MINKLLAKTILSLILSAILFIGGILILFLKIPGWSLFLGIPSIQAGIIFIIFTFDKIAQIKTNPDKFRIVQCSICKNPIAIPVNQKIEICQKCQEKINKKIKNKKTKTFS